MKHNSFKYNQQNVNSTQSSALTRMARRASLLKKRFSRTNLVPNLDRHESVTSISGYLDSGKVFDYSAKKYKNCTLVKSSHGLQVGFLGDQYLLTATSKSQVYSGCTVLVWLQSIEMDSGGWVGMNIFSMG